MLMCKDEFLQCMKWDHKPGFITNFRDGYFCQQHPLTKQYGRNVFWVTLYYDDFVSVNPIGGAAGANKVFAVYWAPTDLAPELRSRTSNMRLLMLAPKEMLQKGRGLKKLLRPLITELNTLARHGVDLPNGQNIKVGVAALVGDNEGHCFIGGFKKGYRHETLHPCRLCHITGAQMQIPGFEADPWTIEDYNAVVEKLPNPDKIMRPAKKHLPLTHECPFNAVHNMHAVHCFPPDMMHDVEGMLHGLFIILYIVL